MRQLTDPGEFAGTGSSLIFNAQSGTYVKFSNIKVTVWNGQLDQPHDANTKTKEDGINLTNQDKVSGKLKSIENGKAQFASTYAELTIPLDRVDEILMATEGADQPKRNAGDVKAFFANRGSLTMQLEQWDGKQAVASSPNFGKATFSPDAFQRIVFNLEQPAPDEDPTDTADSPSE